MEKKITTTATPGFMDYYNDLAGSPNNLSFWFPKIKDVGNGNDLLIPKTVIQSVPPEIMELFFMEKRGMTQVQIMEEIYKWVRDTFYPAVRKDLEGPLWFIKNGSFSNKFEFRQCMCQSSDLMALTSSIVNINYQSLCFETGGNTELIAREFIGTPWNVATIYSGMPLRCEIRVFYDFDRHQAVYAKNYWDWDYCHEAISRNPSDKIVYEAVYPQLVSRFQEVSQFAVELVEKALANVTGLKGIWSVDLMEAGDKKFYLIDMALGTSSAYWDCERVKAYLEENGQISSKSE